MHRFWSVLLLLVLSGPAWAGPPWEGSALLGTGDLCAVYSDDGRSVRATGRRGVQHMYLGDYTADYVTSTAFEAGGSLTVQRVGRDGPYATLTQAVGPEGQAVKIRCAAHPSGAVILEARASRGPLRAVVDLTGRIQTDRTIEREALEVVAGNARARWANGMELLVGPREMARVVVCGDRVVLDAPGRALTVLLVPGAEASARLARLRSGPDPLEAAKTWWEAWVRRGRVPQVAEPWSSAFRANLYAAKSATIRGMVPADNTGQFQTNGMPQLYPRDGMMTARVFLVTGHRQEAADIVRFWSRPEVPKKSPGEFFARYDARCQAVDAGSGARFDEPEWDANGYLLRLQEELGWPGDRETLLAVADFLAASPDGRGLLYEGGIVEWTGYLPTTQMVAVAGLRSAQSLASRLGDAARAERYKSAADRISGSLDSLFDPERGTYAALRFVAHKLEGATSGGERSGTPVRLWDSTFYFGVLWGFPDGPQIRASDRFHQENTVALGGGVQYFEARDGGGVEAYGKDAFFFTSAAAAEYHALHGDRSRARRHLDWMRDNANSYGLMPERILLNGSDCSEASPLSWCCAEFAAAVLLAEEPAWGR